MLCVVASFALVKLQVILLRKRPDVFTNIDDEAYSEEDRFNLKQNGFMVALSLENFSEGAKMDPRYVQFLSTLVFMGPGDDFELQVNH